MSEAIESSSQIKEGVQIAVVLIGVPFLIFSVSLISGVAIVYDRLKGRRLGNWDGKGKRLGSQAD